jgi:TRAP-type uncharacterized transport system fused permease subunit
VTPPTALSPFAAAALTGGNPFRTMMITWKYTLPAFFVPLIFTLSDGGLGLLLVGTPLEIARVTMGAAVGLGAIAVALGGTLGRPLTPLERIGALLGGSLLLLADVRTDIVGAALLALLFVFRELRRRHEPAVPPA